MSRKHYHQKMSYLQVTCSLKNCWESLWLDSSLGRPSLWAWRQPAVVLDHLRLQLGQLGSDLFLPPLTCDFWKCAFTATFCLRAWIMCPWHNLYSENWTALCCCRRLQKSQQGYRISFFFVLPSFWLGFPQPIMSLCPQLVHVWT